MTSREKEIFDIIKRKPLIKQHEISQILNVSRSAVATHIRNLANKGYIKGRKYIINDDLDKKSIFIIGSSNIDIQGVSKRSIIPEDSNPGKIKVNLGGVGRNICENMAKLQDNINFVSVLGTDAYSKNILDNLKENFVDTSNIIEVKNAHISTYLSINNSNKEMYVAISDTKLISYLNVAYLKNIMKYISKSSTLVLDTNLNRTALKYLCENYKGKIIVDSVSSTKALKIFDLLSKIHTLKTNKLEAEALSGIVINDEKSLKAAANKLMNKGLTQLFITLGSKGVYYKNADFEGITPLPVKIKPKDVTGAGDAFTAGIVYGVYHNFSIQKTIKFGLTMSYINIQHLGTVYQELNINLLDEEYIKLWKGSIYDK